MRERESARRPCLVAMIVLLVGGATAKSLLEIRLVIGNSILKIVLRTMAESRRVVTVAGRLLLAYCTFWSIAASTLLTLTRI